ncbi:MAG: hypothetical protein JWM66_1591 [Solirubrobacterales bacterium]|nr:hypothetical protein [Solirubrobacterales bacterium]
MSRSITLRALATVTSGAALLMTLCATVSQADASTLYACVKKNGDARILTKRPKCKRRESRLSWNVAGPAGRNGLNGGNGAPGSDGAAGRTGAAGKDGVNGKDGLNGKDGVNGLDGANGAVGGFAAAQAAGEAVSYSAATEGSPATILSKSLPAGNFIVAAKAELVYTDTKAGGAAATVCKLIDIPAGGGATSSDTSSWASLVNVPALVFDLAQTTIPFSLRVDSPLHASTLTMVCYLAIKETAGGTFSAEAKNASITAVQTTANG